MAESQSGDEEIAVTKDDHKRAVVPNKKVNEEKLHQCINARRSKLRQLTAKSNQIERLMEDENNVTHIDQKEIRCYNKLFEEFVELNHSVALYLNEEESEYDQTFWFEPKRSNCKDFLIRVENWIAEVKLREDLKETSEKDISPMDSVSNVSAKLRTAKSSRCSSHTSSAASSATAIRLKEEAKRAALIAKASSLKEKQALDLKEAQLKADKEQLEIETELAASAARLKIYANYESPQQKCSATATPQAVQQDDDDDGHLRYETSNRYETSAPRLKYRDRSLISTNPPATKPKVRADQRQSFAPAVEAQQQNTDTNELYKVMKRQTDITELLVKNQRLSCLPQRDIPLFHGDPLEFRPFIKAFDHAIHSRTENDADKLYFLEQYTRGEPRDLIKSCQHMPASRGYDQALRLLHERYGNEVKIASALMEKAFKWPKIKSEDGKALSAFSLFLLCCRNTMEDIEYMDELDNPTNLRVVASKLPYKLMEKWRAQAYEIQEQRGSRAKFADLVRFVDKQAKVTTDPLFGNLLEGTVDEKKDKGKSDIKRRTKPEGKRGSSFVTNATPVTTEELTVQSTKAERTRLNSAFSKPCLFCERHHTLEECQKMLGSPHKEKIDFLRKAGLCFGCLTKGHVSKDCKKRMTCGVCALKHPSMLHFEKQESSSKVNVLEAKVQDGAVIHSATSSTPVAANIETSAYTGAGDDCILSIVPVRVKSKKGSKVVETYAFLDPGSSATFCTDTLARQLNLQGRRTELELKTMSPKHQVESYLLTDLEVSSIDSNNFIVLPKVYTQKNIPVSTENIPTQEDVKNWHYLREVRIPSINADVGLLIGNNVHKALEPWHVINSRGNGPYAVKTILGWTVNGPLRAHTSADSENCKYSQATVNRISVENVEQLLLQQYNQDFPERLCDDKVEMSQEDQQFMSHMKDSTYHANGHYIIGLPKKKAVVTMPNNHSVAVQRALALKRKFKRNAVFHQEYCDFMKDMIKRGYAVKVPQNQLSREDGKVWYVPHHGVYHPQKKKLRVVFDCGASFQGTSLNSELLQGPDLSNSLVGVLTRFRKEEVAVMADIEAMYYQVKVHKEDTDLMRFLWWPEGDIEKDMEEFKMTVHLFGATSSPSCANYALRRTAQDNRIKASQEAVDTILNNFYIDDCLRSVKHAAQAISLYKDLKALCSSGGFNLTKWISNSREFLASVPEEERAKEVRAVDLSKDALPIERALGVLWCVESDSFRFRIIVQDKPVTRRGILSTVSSIYDPLGFLSPFTLPAKTLLQQLTKEKLTWDEPVPDKLAQKWFAWLNDLNQLSTFTVKRCLKPAGFKDVVTAQLHHFADASESGYGTVSYLRLTNNEGQVHCAFMLGKSRVAPLKQMTIPRMELTAAVVAVNIDKMLKKEVQMDLQESAYWTDSTTVLKYIESDTCRFKTFVANRVFTIRELTKPTQWSYVNTATNPADCASRGQTAAKLMSNSSWIQGPSFLQEPECLWPEKPTQLKIKEDDIEVRKSVTTNLTKAAEGIDPVNKLIHHYSSWYKLKKAVAWILKFKEILMQISKGKMELLEKDSQSQTNQKKQQVKEQIQAYKITAGKGALTVEDLKRAEHVILSFCQNQRFQDEVSSLKKGNHSLKKGSPLYKLDPILQDGLLRVGGRLSKSCMPAEAKHPIIMPKDSHITTLILRDTHEKIGHCGRNYMLSQLRQRFWIPTANSTVRKFLSRCVICRKVRARGKEQKMADLPKDRLQPDKPPFTYVGTDYFGPFLIKRGRSTVKRYGVLFTCLTTRAVHIEIAHTLDTDSCLNAIRRFMCRRGQVSIIRSDNGSNFVAAERELRDAIQLWNQDKIHNTLRQKEVEWIFSPPTGSHFGGIWERQIRSVRKLLKSILKEQTVDDECLQTLMCEIEAIINDRPITTSSDDPNDLEALTPNHLLLLKRQPSLPPGLFEKEDLYSRRRWKQVQYLADLFWKRWVREYLPLLQERQKWTQVKQNLSPGDVVMIVDDSAPRNSWVLGRVLQTLPDAKGLVRRVLIKTESNTLERPVEKLCLVCENDS